MAKENLSTLKKTQFFDGEKERKQRRANKPCSYRVKRVWDAEKQKYVKVKVYPTKKTFTRAEMKKRFNTKHTNIVVPRTSTSKQEQQIHAKITTIPTRKATGFNLGTYLQSRYEWDVNAKGTIRYKLVA